MSHRPRQPAPGRTLAQSDPRAPRTGLCATAPRRRQPSLAPDAVAAAAAEELGDVRGGVGVGGQPVAVDGQLQMPAQRIGNRGGRNVVQVDAVTEGPQDCGDVGGERARDVRLVGPTPDIDPLAEGSRFADQAPCTGQVGGAPGAAGGAGAECRGSSGGSRAAPRSPCTARPRPHPGTSIGLRRDSGWESPAGPIHGHSSALRPSGCRRPG